MIPTVLSIDDQGDIRRLIRMTLEFEGFNVIEASNGEEGLQMARQHHPDVILLDVMMPGLSGLSVSQMIREDAVLRTIPVVMLTALSREGDAQAGLDTGAKAYLTKPFKPVQLLQLVESLINTASSSSTPSA